MGIYSYFVIFTIMFHVVLAENEEQFEPPKIPMFPERDTVATVSS